MLPAVNDYLNGPFKGIEGWCLPHVWQAIEPLHDQQLTLGVDRPVAEIGVYQGKFLIGLIKTKNIARGNFAIDVFDMHEITADGAPKGNLEALKNNLATCGVGAESIEIERIDSMTIDDGHIESIRKRSGGGFSMFSVDGCHLAEHTINDIRIAMRLTAPEGIIFVDDYYNPNWPGVQESVCKLYLTNSPRFVPLLFTCGKLFLCHMFYRQKYVALVLAHLKARFPTTKIKKVARFGYETLTVLPNLREHAA